MMFKLLEQRTSWKEQRDQRTSRTQKVDRKTSDSQNDVQHCAEIAKKLKVKTKKKLHSLALNTLAWFYEGFV